MLDADIELGMDDIGRLRPFWIRWKTVPATIDLAWPWWFTGEVDGDRRTLRTAVQAADVDAAWAEIVESFDRPPTGIELCSIEEMPDGWQPFNDRFPRHGCHRWPDELDPA